MKKLIIVLYNIFVLTFYRLFGLKIGVTSYIGFHKHLKKVRYIRIGKNCRLRRGVSITCYNHNFKQKLEPRLTIGNNVYINSGFIGLISDKVTIEDNVTLGPNVSIMSHSHGLDPKSKSYLDNDLVVASVTLKEGCWLGDKVIVLPGVTIGKKSVIGAGSVVTKSIDDYCIAVGNPCRIIKRYNFEKSCWEKVNG